MTFNSRRVPKNVEVPVPAKRWRCLLPAKCVVLWTPKYWRKYKKSLNLHQPMKLKATKAQKTSQGRIKRNYLM